ncbi:MAG: PASTA domain-containing protein [Deltaproteobacteria bacterium]|nr:PASTA domain-containing protein [Deltaproteobacteria bacterium]
MSNGSANFAVSFFTSVLTSALVTGGVLYFSGNLKLPGAASEEPQPKVDATAEEVEAPSLKGLTKSVAADVLKARGLRLVVQEERPDNTIPSGQICEQDPLPDSMLNRGGAVSVVVSTGPASAPVPDIIGKPMEEAKDILTDKGFRIGKISESDSGVPGTVVATSPEKGTSAEPESPVDITVAKGVTVPKVVGMYYARGKKKIKEVGLKLGKPQWRYSDDLDVNVILSQEPEADSIVAAGTEIILTVNPE